MGYEVFKMEIMDIIIETDALVYCVKTQEGYTFKHTLASDTPPDKVAHVLRLLAEHVDKMSSNQKVVTK
ncbi:hypothetical protein [Staphylococcus lugdunensis]|jgi:hypothetical protein|nr:hypothetical protein [Staphylococcus lugdunensis]UZW90467.1 hypothetical protein LE165_00385 [Staphylococcus lugdunensis]